MLDFFWKKKKLNSNRKAINIQFSCADVIPKLELKAPIHVCCISVLAPLYNVAKVDIRVCKNDIKQQIE